MDAIVVKKPRAVDSQSDRRFPDLPELTTRLRNGVVEFPVHHVRGGTSTGLIVWDRLAPQDTSLREELLRHLMGLPMTGTRAGNKQITGLGRIVPTGNKVFFAEIETRQRRRAAAGQHLGAACRRQVGGRLERELRQHVRGPAGLGARYRTGASGPRRRCSNSTSAIPIPA